MTLAQLTPGLWEGASARDCSLSLLRGNTKFPFRPVGREKAEETKNGLQSPGANPFLIQLPLLCSFPIYKIGSQQNFCIVAITVLLGTLFPKPVNSWAPRLASTVGIDNSASRAGLGHLNSLKMMEFIQRFQTDEMASRLQPPSPGQGFVRFWKIFNQELGGQGPSQQRHQRLLAGGIT